MASDIEAYKLAKIIIQKCADEAGPKEYAVSQMIKFYDSGNTQEATMWARIAKAIDNLLETSPDEKEDC
jgi:hypothetical protein